MSNPRIHLGTAGPDNPMHLGACGWTGRSGAHLTTIESDVTCKACRKKMGRAVTDKATRVEIEAVTGPLSLPYLGRGAHKVSAREARQIEESRGAVDEPRPIEVDGAILWVSERPWPTFAAAMKEYARPSYASDGVRSSSDFSRDRVQTGGERRIPNEHTYRSEATAKALRAACAGGYSVGEGGPGTVRLDAEDCLRHVVDGPIKGLSYQQIADDLNDSTKRRELGHWRVTERQVRRARSALLRAAHVWMRARGFTEDEPRMVDPSRARAYHGRDRNGNKGGDVALPPGFDTETWTRIADVLGLAESTCRKLAAREIDPLPVRNYLGAAVAKSADLRAWASRQVKERVAS